METPRAPIRTLRLFRLLLWMHWRTLLASMRNIGEKSRLLLLVQAAFAAGYLVLGYWLFRVGLSYLLEFPIVGALLTQRILFLIFGFFFLMLIFSNLIIGYSTLFKSRETAWFLTLPIRHLDVYRWKFMEALVVSSWALIFLSAPMMAAYGRAHGAAGLFYAGTIFAYLPFTIIAALLGSWIILAAVRILSGPWVKRVLIAGAGVTMLALFLTVKPVTDIDVTPMQEVQLVDKLLRHTHASLNPFLPSAWLAQSVLSWSEGLARKGAFFFLVLLSNAMMGLLLGFALVGNGFYASYSAAMSSSTERQQSKAAARRKKAARRPMLDRFAERVPYFSRPIKALTVKDARVFWRDPVQWTQFVIFFGLLCIYVLNLRNVAMSFQNEFWETLISYLNLTASALTLSTLTTRFVFPQFSLEGRRLWIIGLAPIGLRKVLVQKFSLSSAASMSITVSLMTVSSLMLRLETERVIFFALAIGVMSLTLSGLAVGLGALFPNLKEDNPSKIVSGFGGTLCLVVSFLYILCFVTLIALPALRRVTQIQIWIPDTMAVALAFTLSGAVLLVPMTAAMNRVKNLEF
jgi:ABC-2 type transport system permease protein